VLAPGQSWDLTSGKGQVTLPASVADELYSLGVRSISGKVTKLVLSETGAATASANAAASQTMTVPSTPIVEGKPIVVTVGAAHPFTIGPFPTSRAGLIHVALGETQTLITAYGSNGSPLLTTTTDCPAPDPEQLLATIDVGGPPRTGTVNEPGDFPLADIPNDSLIGSTGAVFRCTLRGVGKFSSEVSMTSWGHFGAQGLVLTPGSQIAFEHSHGHMFITPGELDRIARAVRRRPGGRDAVALETSLSRLGITGSDVQPSSANFLAATIPGDPIRLPGRSGRATRTTEVGFPAKGLLLTPFYFTAGRPGILDVFLANARGSFQPVDRHGQPAGAAIPVSCPTPQPKVPLFPALITG
jgi:hypothetical protein